MTKRALISVSDKSGIVDFIKIGSKVWGNRVQNQAGCI